MKKKERLFRFKEFAVRHARSALPVGMDGVLLGAWTECDDASRILDAGCGCGLIALMCAQRNAHASILAADIHEPSVEEASDNFDLSPWSERLSAVRQDFCSMNAAEHGRFDLIVSNPPFFDAGVDSPGQSARLSARHAAAFGPAALLRHGATLLSACGSIALICPAEQQEALLTTASEAGLTPWRLCLVRGRSSATPKRLLIQAGKEKRHVCVHSELTIHTYGNEYTDEYRRLTSPFYLAF